MSYFRKTICSYPNCPNCVESGSKYCTEHKKANPSNRDTTSKFEWLYKLPRWRKDRKEFLLKPENFFCIECGKPSQLPHHSQGFNDYESFFDKSKWVPMCMSCHSRLHTQITNEELWNKYHKGNNNGEES